jgi:hypothetical protein
VAADEIDLDVRMCAWAYLESEYMIHGAKSFPETRQ